MSKNKYAHIPMTDGKKNDEFSSSLDKFKAEDIELLNGQDKKSFKKGAHSIAGIIQYALIFLCAAVFLVCVYLFADNLIDKYKGNKIYNDASELIEPVTISNSSGEDKGESTVMTPYERLEYLNGGEGDAEIADETYSMDLTSVKASLSSLRAENPDVIGWIYVEDTRINYPLMHSSDGNSDYYLTHAYTGEYLAVGSIFLSADCNSTLSENYNSLIYGHNVVNGTMFHDVLKFDDEEFFNNKLIYIYTLEGAYIYKPFSIYQTTSDYNYIQTSFSSESEFLSFASKVKSNSNIASDVTVSSGDTMITLSTCTNGGVATSGRWALHAKLVAFVK